ncbi:hypothetical protein UY3_01539 [Chelonia mydas]|uniref:Myb/SANT-like DNA-binding domain-containing protein n=1 Tax=Chelonia mydas TaxID=8469 RepID=M7BZB8_CHEMY|nr:hypothetical protein UY3_01539 [Chelonia mydas]
MPAPHTRQSLTWSNAELLDLISIWGEEAVQSQLCSSCRNYDSYRQISQCMTERGHDRDTLQCRVKVKVLWNAYHKVRKANSCSGAMPVSCRFYEELDAILGGDSTATVKATLDTLGARVPVESGQSQEEEILDEDVEGEGDPEAEDDSEVRDARSQELFSTPEETSQLQLSELGEAQTGEEAPGAALLVTKPPPLIGGGFILLRGELSLSHKEQLHSTSYNSAAAVAIVRKHTTEKSEGYVYTRNTTTAQLFVYTDVA